MDELNIRLCGVGFSHEKEYVFTQKENSYKDCYLLIYFKTPFECRTKNGIEQGYAYSYVLHEPYFPTFHTSSSNSKKGFVNDWMYINGTMIDRLVNKYNIPLNEIVRSQRNNSISEIISDIHNELNSEFEFKDDKLKVLTLNLFIEFARINEMYKKHINIDEFGRISNVCNQMKKFFSDNWTICDMSHISGYSQSRFISLFRRYFSKSPMDFLIDYRIVQAKSMIESNMMTMTEIADACGFSSLYYFSRVFKSRCGISPSEYKKQYV